jgi:GT2 family glycosyltransferase
VISAIVPTLGGRARLERNLPSVAASLAASGEDWEIVVVDDGARLDAAPPGARVVTLPESRGYGPAVNAGANAARGDLLLILNDDVRMEPHAVRTLRPCLSDGVFAVVPAVLSPFAKCGDEAGKRGEFRGGWLMLLEAPSKMTHPTLYAVGCCLLCPRASFLDFGGFDELYAPFFWEDVELSYRAWRRGLRVLHVPAAVCHHEGSATLAEAHTLATRERVGFRNRVLFHLRNLNDPGRLAGAFGALAAVDLFEPLPERLTGLADALARFETAGRRREPGLGDAEIIARIDADSRYAQDDERDRDVGLPGR